MPDIIPLPEWRRKLMTKVGAGVDPARAARSLGVRKPEFDRWVGTGHRWLAFYEQHDNYNHDDFDDFAAHCVELVCDLEDADAKLLAPIERSIVKAAKQDPKIGLQVLKILAPGRWNPPEPGSGRGDDLAAPVVRCYVPENGRGPSRRGEEAP